MWWRRHGAPGWFERLREHRCRAHESAGESGDHGGLEFTCRRHPAGGDDLSADTGRTAADAADAADQQSAGDPRAVAHGSGRRPTYQALHGAVDAGCGAQCGEHAGTAADSTDEGGPPDISPVDFVAGAENVLLPPLSAEIDQGSGSGSQSHTDRGDLRQGNAGTSCHRRHARGFDPARDSSARGPPGGFGCRPVRRGFHTADAHQCDIDGQLRQQGDPGEDDQQLRVLDIPGSGVQLVRHDPAALRRIAEIFGQLLVSLSLRVGSLPRDRLLLLIRGVGVPDGDGVAGVSGIRPCGCDSPHGVFVAFRKVAGAGRHHPVRKLGR
ncbi:hypothetical protein [Nocardia sp. NPDC051750]|uniref:hypothetical protein n=1 Tax=Nocardia sp. NPDC051750 TaxID=3364325 RepID=UPI0037AEC49F